MVSPQRLVAAREQACADTLAWCVLTDGEHRLLYSPRFGTTYRLTATEADNGLIRAILGLHASEQVEQILDPVDRVLIGGAFEKEIPADTLALWCSRERPEDLRTLRRWYRRVHRHRWCFRPSGARLVARQISRSFKETDLTLERIATLIAATEHGLGVSDCYPRSILGGALCLVAGLPCRVTIGILAPTRKLHAWCSSQGALVYEPTPRHWWFQPLADFIYGP